jgi:hypothetical protein
MESETKIVFIASAARRKVLYTLENFLPPHTNLQAAESDSPCVLIKK